MILSHFDILDLNEFSEHAPLTFNFHLNEPNIQSQHFNSKTNVEIGSKIIWDNAKVDDFKIPLQMKMFILKS